MFGDDKMIGVLKIIEDSTFRHIEPEMTYRFC
jgi:hypothetical protein